MKISTSRILTIIIGTLSGFVFSKAIYYKTGFEYDLFIDKFEITKCILDLVIFGIGYMIAYLLLKHLFKNKRFS